MAQLRTINVRLIVPMLKAAVNNVQLDSIGLTLVKLFVKNVQLVTIAQRVLDYFRKSQSYVQREVIVPKEIQRAHHVHVPLEHFQMRRDLGRTCVICVLLIATVI